jgi:CcmD family protein
VNRVRGIVVFVMLLAGTAVPLAETAQQSPPPPTTAAQDEFVPVSQLPQAEQLPAAPLVLGAYAFIWVATLGYVWLLWRRVGSVERDLTTLRRDIGGKG